MTRVAVVGMGAIGASVAAAVLDGEGTELRCCVRSSAGPITVERPDDTVVIAENIVADPASPAAGPGPVDWVLLATKTYQTDGARPWLDRLVGPRTRVAVLQNGITHLQRVGRLVPQGTAVVPVIVYITAERDGPGAVRQTRPGRLLVPVGEDGEAFAELLAPSATEVAASSDFLTAAWLKLLVNAGSGPIALTRGPNGIAARQPMVELLTTMMTEAAAVGRAEGAVINDDAVPGLVERLGSAADHVSSITADLAAGRPLEWEERNAVIGRLGRRHGLPTPVNDAITALLRTISDEAIAGRSQ